MYWSSVRLTQLPWPSALSPRMRALSSTVTTAPTTPGKLSTRDETEQPDQVPLGLGCAINPTRLKTNFLTLCTFCCSLGVVFLKKFQTYTLIIHFTEVKWKTLLIANL